MNGFIKGYTYLVQVDNYWYIVQQQGMKSWDAIIFSHANPISSHRYLHGNSKTLVTALNKIAKAEYEDAKYHRFRLNNELREAMFNILKTGKIEGDEGDEEL